MALTTYCRRCNWPVPCEVPPSDLNPLCDVCHKFGDPLKPPAPSTCPCTRAQPCSSSCSCANPLLSGGCTRCCGYGSASQRLEAAERLAKAAARVARIEAAARMLLDTPNPGGSAVDAALRVVLASALMES